MDEKLKDMMIYNEVCNIIQKYVNETCENNERFAALMEGKVCTVRDLDYKGLDLVMFLEDKWEMHEISVDTFHCEFSASQMLTFAEKFRTISGAKERTFKYEIPTEKVAEISVPNGASFLVSCCEKNAGYRPPMEYVHFDPKNSALIACDGSMMAVMKTTANLHEELPHGVNIPAAVFKGKVSTINVTKLSDVKVFANDMMCDTEHIYPKWETVTKKYSANQGVMFDKKTWAKLLKTVKTLIKFTDSQYNTIQIYGKNGDKEITLRAYNRDYDYDVKKTVEIAASLQQDISFAINGKKLTNVKQPIIMFVSSPYEAISFVGINRFALVMPLQNDYLPFNMTNNTDKNNLIDPLVLAGIKSMEVPSAKTIETPAETPKEEPKKNLPAVIYKWELKPITEYLPKPEVKYYIKPTLYLPTPKVEETTPEVEPTIEVQTVNGFTVGEFVTMRTFSGDKIACKLMGFSKDEKKAKLNLKGWNKFTVSIDLIEHTELSKNTMPTWLTKGQTITDGNFTSEISDIKRSKIYFTDDSEKALKYVLLNCKPTVETIEVEMAIETPKKKDRWAWLKKIVRSAAIFSF